LLSKPDFQPVGSISFITSPRQECVCP